MKPIASRMNGMTRREFLTRMLKSPMVSVLRSMMCFSYDVVVRLDWDETEPREIADESATMPDGWLESEVPMIADSEAVKPADWYDDLHCHELARSILL